MQSQPLSDGFDMQHFRLLRDRINARLRQIGTRHARRQMDEFPWLYGALGQVPSDVMLVCEQAEDISGFGRSNRSIHLLDGQDITWADGAAADRHWRVNRIQRNEFLYILCDICAHPSRSSSSPPSPRG